MQLTVSSSLEGRDLALLKSVINILGSGDDSQDTTDIQWHYSETPNHKIFIAQDSKSQGGEYYALLKEEEKRINIGISINPKILRQLFNQLTEGKLDSLFETESYFSPGYTCKTSTSKALVEQIYQYMSTHTELDMNIDFEDGLSLIINKTTNKIFATENLDQGLTQKILNDPSAKLTLSQSTESLNLQTFSHSMLANHFLWHLGLDYDQSLLLPDFYDDNVAFRQISWPDYGSLPFKNAFVSLSAQIGRRAESFKSLQSSSDFNEQEVISFLNASCLSACTIVNRENEDCAVTLKRPQDNKSSFINRLKQKLFGAVS